MRKNSVIITSLCTNASKPSTKIRSPQDRADYDIIDTQIGLALFDVDIAQSAAQPAVVCRIAGLVFNPFVSEYAPKPERYGHIIARLEKIPAFLKSPSANFAMSPHLDPDAWRKEENTGNIDLIDKTLRDGVPADQKQAYDVAAAPALEALGTFNRFLKRICRGGRAALVTVREPSTTPLSSNWRLPPIAPRTKF